MKLTTDYVFIQTVVTTNIDFINSSLAAFIDSHFEVDRVTYNIYLDRIEIIE